MPVSPNGDRSVKQLAKLSKLHADGVLSHDKFTKLKSDPIAGTSARTAEKGNPDKPKANYFVRHWRGELSLPLSYWINGYVLGVVANYTLIVVTLYVNPTSKQLKIAVLLAYLGLYCWAWTGIWRSAGRRTPNGPDGWGWAARVTIILVIMGTAIICIWSFVGI